MTKGSTAPTPITIDMGKLIINGKEFLIDGLTINQLSAETLEEIKELLQGKSISILCSIGTNKKCEKEYLNAQIAFFAELLKQDVIKSIDIIACDLNQRHNYQIEHLDAVVRKIGSDLVRIFTDVSQDIYVSGLNLNTNPLEIALGALKDFTPSNNTNITQREQIELLLNNVRKHYEILIHSSLKEAQFKQSEQLAKILKYLDHFDLYVTLHSMKMKLAEGNKWHGATLKTTKTLDHSRIRIQRWCDIYGMYSPTQQCIDRKQREFLTKEYKAKLERKNPTDLLVHERAILDGYRETNNFKIEEELIISDMVLGLTEGYKKFLKDTRTNCHLDARISDDKQAELLKVLTNLLETGNKEGNSSDQPNDIKTAFISTILEYLSRKERENWVTKIGYSQEFCNMISTDFILEELIHLIRCVIVAYPGKLTLALEAIFKVLECGTLWCNNVLRKDKIYVEKDSAYNSEEELEQPNNSSASQLSSESASSQTVVPEKQQTSDLSIFQFSPPHKDDALTAALEVCIEGKPVKMLFSGSSSTVEQTMFNMLTRLINISARNSEPALTIKPPTSPSSTSSP